jgi:large subunit ribosomal protein L4e
VTPLVLARGHRIQEVPELPLVVNNLNVETTKTLIGVLRKLGVGEELKRTRESRKVRQGHGKVRNGRYVLRKGPLIIYGDENNLIKRAAKNLPGVDTCNVHRLNLLQLAPGGHLGRFIIWTKDAFSQLNNIFGNYRAKGVEKGGYVLNRNVMTCADLSRIINSDQVQSKLRAVRKSTHVHDLQKKNPLTNRALMKKLNPFHQIRREAERLAQEARHKKRVAGAKAHRKDKATKAGKKTRNANFKGLMAGLTDKYAALDKEIADENALDIMAQESEDDE